MQPCKTRINTGVIAAAKMLNKNKTHVGVGGTQRAKSIPFVSLDRFNCLSIKVCFLYEDLVGGLKPLKRF